MAPEAHTCQSAPTWVFGLRPGDDDENDALQAECPGCAAEDAAAAALARWEDEPLDPRDDLALLADYPDELDRVREMQQVIAEHPVYRIVDRIGGELRAAFLAAVDVGTAGFDHDAAEAFYDARVCRCERLGAELADGTPIYRRHRDAARCPWCVLKADMEQAEHDELQAQVRAEFELTYPASADVRKARTAAHLLDLLRGA